MVLSRCQNHNGICQSAEERMYCFDALVFLVYLCVCFILCEIFGNLCSCDSVLSFIKILALVGLNWCWIMFYGGYTLFQSIHPPTQPYIDIVWLPSFEILILVRVILVQEFLGYGAYVVYCVCVCTYIRMRVCICPCVVNVYKYTFCHSILVFPLHYSLLTIGLPVQCHLLAESGVQALWRN